MVVVALVFSSFSTVSLHSLGAQKDKKKLVGISGIVVTLVMYASPLSNACPNIIGVLLGIGQMVLYGMYWEQPSNEEKKVSRFDPEISLKENIVGEETDSIDAEETTQEILEMVQIQKMKHTFDSVGEK